MKRLISLFLFFFLVTAVISCKKKNETNSNIDLPAVLVSGKWQVHYFFYTEDQTGNFSDVALTFKTDGSLETVNSIEKYNGFWEVKKDSDGSPLLTLSVRALTDVQLLSNNWKLTANKGMFLEFKETPESAAKGGLHLKKQ
jgi:hypothetical protein